MSLTMAFDLAPDFILLKNCQKRDCSLQI